MSKINKEKIDYCKYLGYCLKYSALKIIRSVATAQFVERQLLHRCRPLKNA